MTRCRWVAARRAEGFPIKAACGVAGVSRQGFYAWQRRCEAPPRTTGLAKAELVGEIRRIHADSGGTYGSPRVTAELARRGRCVNHKRVERLMRLWGIVAVHKRRRRRSARTGAGLGVAPADLVRRDFAPGASDTVWAGDITFIPTDRGWLYLAVVLDLGSRRLIGYAMATDMRAQLVLDALDMVAGARGGRTAGIVFQPDRDPHYLAREHSAALARYGMRQSADRVGNCWDNRVVETFFSSLKRELVHRRRFATRDQARREIFAWMGRYNSQRLHSSHAYATPREWEADHRPAHQLEQAA